ncbi:MAG: DUF3048 domain-containing protein [Clostridia bacterium]|nr:DUF3048 domain-containing protein [Clostridia bacterium]
MGKFVRPIAWVLALALAFSLVGCGEDPVTTPVDAPVVDEPGADTPISPVVGQFQSTVRPYAVMIDNDDQNARPQAGVEDAYLVYEMMVEGGASRMMAFFRDVDTAKIGPVRSSRHYFLDYVMEHDAIYVHFGWSPRAQSDLESLGLDKINGVLGSDGDIYWRERKFAGDWHSAYTSIAKIKAKADAKCFKTEGKAANIPMQEQFAVPQGTDHGDIRLTYSGSYRVGYVFDAETNTYKRYINGGAHTMQSGVQLAPTNVIALEVANFPLGDGSARQDLTTVGSGKGVYFTAGKAQPITWSKASRSADTKYTLEDGSALTLNPGQTFVQLVPPGNISY